MRLKIKQKLLLLLLCVCTFIVLNWVYLDVQCVAPYIRYIAIQTGMSDSWLLQTFVPILTVYLSKNNGLNNRAFTLLAADVIWSI